MLEDPQYQNAPSDPHLKPASAQYQIFWQVPCTPGRLLYSLLARQCGARQSSLRSRPSHHCALIAEARLVAGAGIGRRVAASLRLPEATLLVEVLPEGARPPTRLLHSTGLLRPFRGGFLPHRGAGNGRDGDGDEIPERVSPLLPTA